MRFSDNIKDIAGIGIARIIREGEDRENWRRSSRLSQQPNHIVLMMMMMMVMMMMIMMVVVVASPWLETSMWWQAGTEKQLSLSS